jgi:hypothetical protein
MPFDRNAWKRQWNRKNRSKETEFARQYRKKNPDRMLEINRRAGAKRLGYVDPGSIARKEMYLAQGGVCAICKEAKAVCIDHDHTTGKIRELLCQKCNFGIGQFRDDKRIVQSALEYLDKHEAVPRPLLMKPKGGLETVEKADIVQLTLFASNDA